VLQITPWERSALQLLADGAAITVLASHLGTSEGDVEARLKGLYERMGVIGRTEAVQMAFRRGLVSAVPGMIATEQKAS
jgi:DNA-binding NarL/FixJ family response regulator